MRINFDFGDLEGFLALSETGSFARAAERLNISQSALSRRIQKLEQALGVALFERTTRSVAPTPEGRTFVDVAAGLLADVEDAARALGQADETGARRRGAIVSVAAVPTATQNLLPAAIRRFRAEGHVARIRIRDTAASAVVDTIEAGEADFGVGFLSAREPTLDFRPIADDPFVLVMLAGDPMADRTDVRWQDIDADRFIAIWKGSGNRMLIEAALARARIALDWRYEAQHLSTALGLVEAGLGVTALPRSAVRPGMRGIVARPLIEPVVSRTVGVVRRTRVRLSEPAEALYGAILEAAAG